ncbi:MAG TPA: glutathione peroxidase [Candidatus Omnitrophota bacterium]|mgnify:CR=1 FL=1|nr:glutathione peroxidase [Candidatus Omnitrophota bacterium]HQL41115.1 glutathione peroxidase [Candidatus Omnitrophota bacterium]
MKILLLSVMVLGFFAFCVSPLRAQSSEDIYGFTVSDIDGKPVPLSDYKGKVLLIVNTASNCGLTPQYKSLEELYQKYKDRGFVVLAFPANNFMGQEPGTNEEIKNFCTINYKTTFPLFSKISVQGEDIAPLYAYLTGVPGFEGGIIWNFNKFLIDRAGKVVGRFASPVNPMSEEMIKAVEGQL